MPNILPRHVVRANFIGSSFKDGQLEMFLECLAVTQHRMNPDGWTPFSWEEYVAKCDHAPIPAEQEILEAMVNGGTVQLTDMGRPKHIVIAPGYLSKDGDRYHITDLLMEIMMPFAQAA